jgi:uncharacterized protein YdaU (DUF1376 family)
MRDTGHLSLEEHGAYTILLDHYYATKKPLPSEIPALFRICRAFTDSERTSVSSVLDQFFPVGADGNRHNARADKELSKEQAISKSRANAGAKGADGKWHGKRHGKPMANAIDADGKCHSKPMAIATTTTTTTTDTATTTTTKENASDKQKQKRSVSVEEWMQDVRQSYEKLGLNVDIEETKARAWLSAKGGGRQFTKAYFSNWLARAADRGQVIPNTKPKRPVNHIVSLDPNPYANIPERHE